MDPALANEILHEDAITSKEEGLSVAEWEERITEERHLREAAAVAGPKVIDALTRFVWKWDRSTKRKK